jgi:hypothetical protein
MLDFCEVQHPKLNRRAALGRASQSAKYSMAFHFAQRNMFFFAQRCQKERKRIPHIIPQRLAGQLINHGLIDKPQNLCYNKVITREREIQTAGKLR